ncbi:EF-hand domain-containing protein [Actinomadura hibisca]|uniref:EF-hand domain-containing protein n=1 Tax=Actinomadura hibisca TaxID=68565 RepID=UPI000831C79A|nr:EF-hand domain-containing protein [Actinomadura hibisca]
MASEFQRRKVAGVFAAMDADGDGALRETDFSALTARWAEIRGSAPGSPDHARLAVVMMGWWSTLLSAAEHDDRVTLDDVLRVVDRLDEMPEAVAGTAATMFEAIDENGDGRIDAAEYRRLIEAWSGRPTDTDEIFPLLDLDGDGHLSAEEFCRLWTEFWAGDDPRHPGTWVFGDPGIPVPQRA